MDADALLPQEPGEPEWGYRVSAWGRHLLKISP